MKPGDLVFIQCRHSSGPCPVTGQIGRIEVIGTNGLEARIYFGENLRKSGWFELKHLQSITEIGDILT